jgi:dihydrodipicolinate synthase/N-acetylneuraminate lyase
MHHAPIHGILAPNIVPLDEAGGINEPELRRYVDWLIEKGVHGLYPNGSTGERIARPLALPQALPA